VGNLEDRRTSLCVFDSSGSIYVSLSHARQAKTLSARW
jgi:hypothetical protein